MNNQLKTMSFKKVFTALFTALFTVNLIIFTANCFSQGVAINTTGTAADPSAMLDVSSTNSGILITRMTTNERNAINNPAEGLQIYNTTTKCLEIFEYGIWQKINCAFNCSIDRVKFNYRGTTVTYGTVLGQNNTCWLDRNLGALSVATAYNDINAFGDLFQWGRGDDGHQIRNSGTTSILINTEIAGHSNFIVATTSPYDWQIIQNNNLWQGGENSINNPCPEGWRIPTATEFNNERLSWTSNDFNGAFNSSLKLTAAGCRDENGSLTFVNIDGRYYSSNIDGINANYFVFYNNNSYIWIIHRACALSIRCIKE